MADSKITDLTAATTLDDADLMVIVDSADTTTKKITGANVKASIGSGLYTPPSGFTQLTLDANASSEMTLNREYVMGFLLGAVTVSTLSVVIQTAGDAAAVVRVGIRADATGVPSTPQADTTVSGLSTGWKTATMSYAHPGGVLWVSLTGQGWSATAVRLGLAIIGMPRISPNTLASLGWAVGHGPAAGMQDGVTGALPATFVNAAQTNQPMFLTAIGV